jgi:predicted kinase
MPQFLLQMAGEPACGKSTLARAIGGATGAVVIDKDVIMSAAMNSGVERQIAGGLAYEVGFDLARSFLLTGHSVIHDSPAFFISIREKGARVAAECGAKYAIIECVLSNRDEQALRLAGRTGLVSQPVELESFYYGARAGTAALTEPHLTVDTSMSMTYVLARALWYLSE